MAQHTTFPDYKDRSLNHPSVLVNINEFLDLYYQQNPEVQTMSNSDEDQLRLKQWFANTALAKGWPTVGFLGKDALLSIAVPISDWLEVATDDVSKIDNGAITNVTQTEAETQEGVPVEPVQTASTAEVKGPDTTVPGNTGSSGCASRLHVSVDEVANSYGPKISHDYKRG